jgi:hypothetical protein
MSLCILAGAKSLTLAVSAFTLAWTHSVERTSWEEDWRVTAEGLELVEARVEGSGAGMEPPPGAVLEDGRWTYRPDLPAQEVLILAHSGAIGKGWRLCAQGSCRELAPEAGAPLELRPCGKP